MNIRFRILPALPLLAAATISGAAEITISGEQVGGTAASSFRFANGGTNSLPVQATVHGGDEHWLVVRQGAFGTLAARSSADVAVANTNFTTEVWVPLTHSTKTFYARGDFPPLSEGTVAWNIASRDSSGEMVRGKTYSFTVTNAVADVLPKSRKPDFADFRAQIGITGRRTAPIGDWRLNKVSMLTAGTYEIDLPGISAATYGANTPAYLHSATALSGVGTIWFKARYNGTNDTTAAKLSVIVGTGGATSITTPIMTETIEFPVEVNQLGELSQWKQFRIDVNLEGNLRVRFRNDSDYGPGFDTAFENENLIQLADIVIAPISPDVLVKKDPLDYAPGYPAAGDPVSFRIHVTNMWESVPVTNISPKLVWRTNGEAWNETIMTNTAGWSVQGDGTYACTLPDAPAGPFEYFHRVDFAGNTAVWKHESALYASGSVPGISDGVANAEEFLFWQRPDGYVSESHCPGYGPDFIEAYGEGAHWGYQEYVDSRRDLSYLFDLYGEAGTGEDTFWPKAVNGAKGRDNGSLSGVIYPVTNAWARFSETADALAYEYRAFQAEDGVRRFRSLYDKVSLVTSNDYLRVEGDIYSGSHLDASYPMQQVGDYTWQAIVRLTNAVDVAFSVHTTSHYDENSPDAFGRGTGPGGAFAWGQVDQSAGDIYPPMAAEIERSDKTGTYGEDVVDDDGNPVAREANPVHVQLTYDGFLMFRFCTTNGEYQIRRAAWQDFNEWQADDTRYSQSYGLYGAKIFDVVTSNLTVSAFGSYTNVYLEPTVQPTPEDAMLDSRGTSAGGLLLRNAWIADTKSFVPTNAATTVDAQRHHRAYRLSGAKTFLGSLETVGHDQYRGGRDSFQIRVRSSSDDDRFALYKNTPHGDSSTGDGYRVMAYVKAGANADKGDATNSVSAIGFWQDEANYWEARVSEGRRHKVVNNVLREFPMLRLEVFLVQDGVRRRVGNVRERVGDNADGEIRAGDAVVLWLKRSGNGVISRAQFFRGMKDTSVQNESLISTSNAGQDTAFATTVTNGLAGVNAREFGCTLVPYVFEGYTGTDNKINGDKKIILNGSTAQAYRSMSTTSDPSAWELSKRREWGFASPWTMNQPTGTVHPYNNPVTFKKAAPKVFYRLLANRTGKEEAEGTYLATADSQDFSSIWDTDWDEHERHAFDRVMSVESYSWTTNYFPLHFWDDSFVRVEVSADNGASTSPLKTAGDLAVDVLPSWEWRGKQAYDGNRVYESDGIRDTEAWHGSYSAIVREGLGNPQWDIDLTRARAVDDVYIDSPYLENGVGDLTFNWTAPASSATYTNYPVVLRIERRDESNSSGETVGLVTTLVSRAATTAAAAANASSWTNFSGSVRIACLTNNVSGRFRIQPVAWMENGTNRLGRVRVENLRATDYPASGDTSWEGYNILVSTFTVSDETRRLKFDGYSKRYDSMRTAVVNDNPSKQTLPDGFVFGEHLPFIQTPSIQTGVGEISFWYRGHPDNGGAAASLSLQVATRETPTDEDWVVLTADRLERDEENPELYDAQVAALEGLRNITTNGWVYFNAEFFEKQYPLLRIYSATTNDHNRVMIDNILVTEPVRAGVDIGGITFVPDIPLSGSTTAAKVLLVNPRMRPEITAVELLYYVGTNKWGYAEWKNQPTGRLSMSRSPTDEFLYVTDEPMPAFPIDEVVQYCAIAYFTGKGGASHVVSAEQTQNSESGNLFVFENPEWYRPVDLNADFGTTNIPVAHFWVFSTPTNAAFINEIYPAYRAYANATRQFVELIGPEGASLGNWTLSVPDAVAPDYVPSATDTKFVHTVAPDAAFQADEQDKSGKGWGFYVFGGPDVATRDQELFTDELTRGVVDQNVVPDEWYWTLYAPGALVLKRSMGAWVDRVCWAVNDRSETAALEEQGFRFLGTKSRRTNSAFSWNDDDENGYLVWSTLSFMSPGGYNAGQSASIWKAPGVGEVEPVPPEDPPQITDLKITNLSVSEPELIDYYGTEMEMVVVHLDGTFVIKNGSSLLKNDFEWQFLRAPTLEDLADPNGPYVTADVFADYDNPVAPAGQELVDFSVDIFVPAEEQAQFFKIRAIPLERN